VNELWERLKEDSPEIKDPQQSAENENEYFGFLYLTEMILWKFCTYFDPKKITASTDSRSSDMAKSIPIASSRWIVMMSSSAKFLSMRCSSGRLLESKVIALAIIQDFDARETRKWT
jgi:hypothetical protein